MKPYRIALFLAVIILGCALLAQPIQPVILYFNELIDTPEDYTGDGGKVLAVNSGETAVEFITIGVGVGDMLKSTYDADTDDLIDQAAGGTELDTSGVTNGQLLIGNTTGNVWALATLTGVANETDIANAASSITIGIVDPLIVAKGGTGATSLNDGFVLLGSNTAAITPLDVTTDGGIIIGDGTTDPVVLDVGSSTAITILGTVGTGVWQGTAIADGYIPDNITIDLATLATTVTVSDDESTDDDQEIVFTTDNVTLESDGDFHYSPDTGTVTATEFVGGGSGLTHTHDGDTLQLDGVNSDGGAFPFTTSGPVSFSQSLIILNSGTIGSVSDTGIITLAADGSVAFQPTADNTTFLQALDADGGTPILNIDSTNERVGIGTATPSQTFEVNGNAAFTQYLVHSGDADTFINYTVDQVAIDAGGERFLILHEDDSQDYVELGDDGDIDIKLSGGADGALFVQGSDGYVGIGTLTPANPLHVYATGIPYRVQRHTTPSTGQIFTGMEFYRSTSGTAVDGIGAGVLISAEDDGGNETYAAMIGGGLSDVTDGAEVGQIVFAPSYNGQAPGTRTDMTITATGSNSGESTTRVTGILEVYNDDATLRVWGPGGGRTPKIDIMRSTGAFGVDAFADFRISNAAGYLHIIGGANTSSTTHISLQHATGEVGIGETSPQDTLEVNGTGLFKDALKFTQDDGNEYIDSDADGYLDLHATTAVRAHTGFVIPSGTTPAPAVVGAIFLDTDASANGDLMVYANGAWRKVVSLP